MTTTTSTPTSTARAVRRAGAWCLGGGLTRRKDRDVCVAGATRGGRGDIALLWFEVGLPLLTTCVVLIRRTPSAGH